MFRYTVVLSSSVSIVIASTSDTICEAVAKNESVLATNTIAHSVCGYALKKSEFYVVKKLN